MIHGDEAVHRGLDHGATALLALAQGLFGLSVLDDLRLQGGRSLSDLGFQAIVYMP